MAAQVAAGGQTRIPAGAGPGAGRPNRRSSSRQARKRLQADHLLLQDGRDQRLEHPAGPADAAAGVPEGQLAQQRVGGPEVAGPVAGAEQVRQRRPASSPLRVPRPGPAPGSPARPGCRQSGRTGGR